MSSSKEDGTAAAAEQPGSMSFGESVERKDNETENNEDAAEENEAPNKLCSACDKESDALMKCRACKCVWYCDKECQNKHWKEHKHECKSIKEVLDKRGGKLDVGTELDIGPLEKLPPREECPICMHALPHHAKLHTYFACCGKSICSGCTYQHKIKSGDQVTCVFCRTAAPRSDEELLARTRKRVELKDPTALFSMAMYHGRGQFGLQVDQTKCIDLMGQAAALGYTDAQYQLGNFYKFGTMGLEQNDGKAIKYWEKAAEGGNIRARNNLGCVDGGSGDHVAAMRHWRLSASGGFKKSMENLIVCFENGDLHHQDLAETLQVFYSANAEMKSDDRDKYIKHLKEAGEYRAEYDL